MEKKFIRIIISICCVIFFSICMFLICGKNEYKNEKNLRNNIDLNVYKDNSISKKALLYGIINNRIDEDTTIEMIEKEINETEFKSGIWISERAREVIIDILYISTNIEWKIDNYGYLEVPTIQISNSDVLSNKIVNIINNNSKLIIIDFNETYKGIINTEILDFMVERTAYVERLEYNENLLINIINPMRYKEGNEDISEKEKCEEILINIFT